MSSELTCIMKTGLFKFTLSEGTGRSQSLKLVLQYEPSTSRRKGSFLRQDSAPPAGEQSEVPAGALSEEWGMDQISDFGHQLGFLDARKKEGNQVGKREEEEDDEEKRVQHFQHLNEVCKYPLKCIIVSLHLPLLLLLNIK